MFAMNGILSCENNGTLPHTTLAFSAYSVADAMMEARKNKESAGLPAIRRRPKKGE
jgi:hypothetical protein